MRSDHPQFDCEIPADELTGMLETAHLLRSLKKAKRLLAALDRVKGGTSGSPQPLDDY
ncbi:hypothetical protein [Candidatus Electrothrix sp.]|uniref:hypothetical protein n=1 Tax=Candidatus Electrothrix sp. TaxID=2170559 RepID=UPI004056A6AB